MSEYTCSACGDLIPSLKARIHCQTCRPSYELCANCFVVQNFSQRHQISHSTVVVTISGHYHPPPPSSPNPPLPQRPPPIPKRPVSLTSQQTTLPTASQKQYSQSSSPQPPLSSPRPPQQSQQRFSQPQPPHLSSQQQHQTFPSSPNLLPPPPPPQDQNATLPPPPRRSVPPQVPTSTPTSTRASASWQPLYGSDMQPTPMFNALMKAFFNRLDAQQTGAIRPEAYSSFLDSQGYTLEQDVWKKNCVCHFGFNKEDPADFELTRAYKNFSIEHNLAPRNAPINNDMENLVSGFSGLMNPGLNSILKASAPKPMSGGMMPMLTLRGFIDITALETLADPSAGWINLNRALKHYNIWREIGDISRNMLPDYAPQQLLDRIKQIQQISIQQSQDILAASYVENSIKAQGRQNAIDLIDGPRYYYRY